MSKRGSERAVVISALVVFAIYFYRHLTEGTTQRNGGTSQLLGIGTPANVGRFLTAWGAIFFGISILAEAAPSLGGSFAILVATGDVLTNAQDVIKQVNKGVAGKTGNSKPVPASPEGKANVPSPGAGNEGAAAVGSQGTT